MDLIGRSTLHPVIFYSGKICGYIVWILIALSFFGVEVVPAHQYPALRTASALMSLSGVLLIVLSSISLGSSVSLGLPREKTVFKKAGIYTISRNPMYLGFNLITAAAVLGIIHIAVAIMGIYSIVVYHFIILGEEKFLQERFGQEYAHYRKTVRRYL